MLFLGDKQMSILEDYKLSQEEHDQVFREIEWNTLTNIKSKRSPTIVIVGGQPGSGKSTLINHYRNILFKDEDVCIINGDELRRYHPQSDIILSLFEKKYAEITDLDVRVWTKRLFDLAVDKNTNIIFEGTLRTTQICDTIKRLYNKGYKVIVSPMAVPFIISIYSIYNRYMRDKQENGQARFVPFSSHNESYFRMIDTLREIVREKNYDKIEVFGRVFGYEKIKCKTDDEVPKQIKRYRSKKLSIISQRKLKQLARILIIELRKMGEEEVLSGFLRAFRKWENSI